MGIFPSIGNSNEWSTGLCDCTKDCRSCCLTCWCPCVAFGRNAEIVDKGQNSCFLMGCIFYLLNLTCHYVGCSWIISMGYRSKLRKQYGIKGGSCQDCLIHFCCQSCALCQEYRELESQGFDVSAGWDGNTSKKVANWMTLAPVWESMKR
ncbi:unnamed protein product [Coffea canephora]|uniref:Uncharacterized protein n=2 Tax=Coffea TaxID=13442 RepID=A0A068TY17_COFCA|nr:cell number regulator 9-like isoform X1 [Coffea arabica]CDP00819.1 unnamed protein product [Coffea canephora]